MKYYSPKKNAINILFFCIYSSLAYRVRVCIYIYVASTRFVLVCIFLLLISYPRSFQTQQSIFTQVLFSYLVTFPSVVTVFSLYVFPVFTTVNSLRFTYPSRNILHDSYYFRFRFIPYATGYRTFS